MSNRKTGQVIIEFNQIGTIVRVTAIDTVTGTEAVFQAPASTSRAVLERTAIDKLNYVLRKEQQK